MKLSDQVTLAVPLDDVWAALQDLERLAPCMPGATLTGRDGSTYQGRVKLKVGPVVASYEGEATIIEVDEAAHRIRVSAKGRETSGQGTADAMVEVTASGDSSSTHVAIETDLAIGGRLAQFGRGLMADVSTRVLGEFAANVEASLRPDGRAEGGSTGAPASEMNALALVGPALAKRIAPVALGLIVLLWVLGRRRQS